MPDGRGPGCDHVQCSHLCVVEGWPVATSIVAVGVHLQGEHEPGHLCVRERWGGTVDVISFNKAISACEKSGQWQNAASIVVADIYYISKQKYLLLLLYIYKKIYIFIYTKIRLNNNK